MKMTLKEYKKNLILFLVITGIIRVLFVVVPMGMIVWYRYTNSVTTDEILEDTFPAEIVSDDTEMIKK